MLAMGRLSSSIFCNFHKDLNVILKKNFPKHQWVQNSINLAFDAKRSLFYHSAPYIQACGSEVGRRTFLPENFTFFGSSFKFKGTPWRKKPTVIPIVFHHLLHKRKGAVTHFGHRLLLEKESLRAFL